MDLEPEHTYPEAAALLGVSETFLRQKSRHWSYERAVPLRLQPTNQTTRGGSLILLRVPDQREFGSYERLN